MTGKRRGLYAAVLILALLFASIPPARAETTLREALRKVSDSPLDGAAHSDLARAYNKNGEPGKAASEAKAALALIPGFPPAMLELAHARRAEGMQEEAEALYEVYLGCHPRSVEGLAGVSESLARLGKWDESFASAMAAIKEAPLDSMGYHALGRAYRISGRFEEAVEVLGQALSFASEPSCILFEIGICHVELGDRPSALTQYEKLLETDRDRAALLFQAIYP